MLPQTLPCFPLCTAAHTPWPANFLVAYDTLSDIYRHAYRILKQEDADPLQLTYHLEAIAADAMPLLEAFEVDPRGLEVRDWLSDAATLLGNLSVQLSSF
ncbi:hypothetical protein P692DRAFT_20130166 [Suillus brevipes Sb2]|nr:hypothetical protein P692DRAFT_20130166 [Suillus brevipes Sb2]